MKITSLFMVIALALAILAAGFTSSAYARRRNRSRTRTYIDVRQVIPPGGRPVRSRWRP
jgi:hypothetical protein